MFGFESYQVEMYLGMIAIALCVLALAAGIVAVAVNDVATSLMRRRSANPVTHTTSPE